MILYYATLFLFIRHTKENLECNKLTYPCCVNQYLNKVNNSCSECPHGSFGWNCKMYCPSGYYGRLCKSPCECNATECHHVTGCETTSDSNSGTQSINHVTTQTDLLQPPTIANETDEVFTYQDNKISGLDRHIHTEDVHASSMSTLGFSLLGSLSSLCIIGCILFIHSWKKKWKFTGSLSYSRMRQAFLSCVNQDRQQEMIQESGDIELSNVNRTPVRGQEEEDSPYSEIRYSQFIGGATKGGSCINTASCTIHKCDSNKHHNTSEKQNIYLMSMNKNEYDHVNLKVKYLDMFSDRNLRLPHSDDEEYVSLMNKPSFGTEVRSKDGLKCQNLKLPKNTITDCNKMDKSESKPQSVLTGYSLQQFEFKIGVDEDISENTKHHSVAADKNVGPQSDDRPYSMAEGLSENDLSETDETQPNLSHLNISEKLNLSNNDFSEKVENSINSMNIDIPRKREDTSSVRNNGQSNIRPYSFAKML